MKTPISQLASIMILPAALLLSQCAPTSGTQSMNLGAVPTATLHRVPVSLGTEDYPQDSPTDETWPAPFENVPLQLVPDNPADNQADGVPTLLMPAVRIKTDRVLPQFPDDDDWPSSAAEAQEKCERIFGQPQPKRGKPMGESVEQWLKSHR